MNLRKKKLLKLLNDWVTESKDEYCLIKEVDPTFVFAKVQIYESNDCSFLYVFMGEICQTPTNLMRNTMKDLNILPCQD